nr:hypothetical protein [Tanacetum cinerariifolium]
MNSDTKYLDFEKEPRNVRLGLAVDGFNPFGNLSQSYSMWPVILTRYNLPSWLCMKKSSFMLTLLIHGPKSLGKDIDVYLRPLIDDLKDLWAKPGVETIDVAKGQKFNMRAMVFWTINDFLARSSLSGWSGQGYKACPTCNEDTPSVRVLGKTAYVGHRRFLKKPHKWRRSLEFNGEKEDEDPPREFSWDQIQTQLARLPTRVKGKHLKIQKYLPPNIAKLLIKLCLFFKQICSQTLMVDDMLKAQSKVIDILCNLELIYPPVFFDIMIHLVIHLPLEAIDGEPIRSCGYNDPGFSKRSELFALACGPSQTSISVNSCVVNGVRRPLGWKVFEYVSHNKFLNGGVIMVEDDPDVIHVDNSSDFALSTSLNDLEITALHIDDQSIDVDAPPDIIDVDEDDDIIDEEDLIPHDLADFDDEDLINLDIDDGVNMSVDAARGHNDDGGSDDRPFPYQIPIGCGGCLGHPKTRFRWQESGQDAYLQETRNLELKAIADKNDLVPIRFEFGDRQTLMPLDDHVAHWANYIGELVRELPLHYPSWHQMPPERKAGVVAKIETQFDLRTHMESNRWPKIYVGIQQHLQKIYNGKKAALKERYWVPNEDGTYDMERIRRGRPSHISK